MPPMKYPEIVADKLTLQAGHGSIAVPLLRMVGVGSLTLTREGRRYIVRSDELLGAF